MKERYRTYDGSLDLDIALLEQKQDASEEDSSVAVIPIWKVESANWLSLILIKRSLSYTIRGCLHDNKSPKDFLDAIWEKSKESNKTNLLEWLGVKL